MARTPLTVLCFGDSLTQGYHNYGLGEQPYSEVLAERLEAALPERDVQVVTSGVPGDRAVLRPFRQRLKTECEARSYDWVIMLAGTNDLPSFPAHKIMSALQAHWNIPLAKGSKVLALTVPEGRVRFDWLENARRQLNSCILAHKQPNFYAFDLLSKIPYHSLSKQDRDMYWDDGVHLTGDGYDWMGGHIADALLHILSQEGKPTEAARPEAPREPAKEDDEPAFDEEAGSPNHISRGYVVVRKKDLD
ncbi:Uncharacterized protein TPAR_03209 [Tolypocladium paradoxum]|uniref:SGNH hydrolase-type esterase domain-containing protein n=1 Tax=Tolypocladium paradoxum TaxID=94208 RepID=A0A2S4L266_9HYPO|nr:Uncharacterized protein TPAR_03209 [Tolypocladium paradoxum]